MQVLAALRFSQAAGQAGAGLLDQLVHLHREHSQSAIPTRCCQLGSIRAESHPEDIAGVAVQREKLLPALEVPDLGEAVKAGRSQLAAVPAESQPGNQAGMTAEGQGLNVPGDIPHVHFAVLQAQGQQLAARADRQAVDLPFLRGKCLHFLAGLSIPLARIALRPAAKNRIPILAKCDPHPKSNQMP